MFENDVEMYGAQALVIRNSMTHAFENDVEMYGAQAHVTTTCFTNRLRMM